MELIEGEAPKGPLPLSKVLDIGRQIAEALKAAHEKGITHRDLKPGNLRLTPEGKVKVLDFGLAKWSETSQESSQNSPTLTMAATQAGVILGTAAYMSPEQARGKLADRRADIWAFGVVLHELLTGESAFEGDTVSDTLAGVLRADPDLTKVPPQIRRLLKRCLEKDPTRRLQDIGDAWDLLDQEQDSATPARRRMFWPAATVITTAAALALAVIAFRPAPAPEITRFQIAAPSGNRLPLGTPSPSPDGRSLAYTMIDSKGIQRIYIRRLDRTEPEVLPDSERGLHPFWSPDGRSIAFVADNVMKRVDLDGGTRVLTERVSGPWHGDWNSKGDILASMLDGTVRVSGLGAAPPALILSRKDFNAVGHAVFVDDQRLLFRSQEADGRATIRVAELGSKDTRIVLDKVDSAPLVASTPGGRKFVLYLQEEDLAAQELDPAGLTLRGDPFVLIPNIGRVANPAVKPTVGVSSSGILAYQTASVSDEFTWFDKSGKRVGAIPVAAATTNFRLSPDGNLLAYRGEDGSLWVLDLKRGSPIRLTSDNVNNIIWSPDGKKIAFRDTRNTGILSIAIDGTGGETLFENPGAPRSWLTNGLVVTNLSELLMLPLPAGQPPVSLARGVVADGRVSPDGSFIAIESLESGRREIYLQPMPPGKGRTKVSINGGQTARWRRDGKELFFRAPEGVMMAVDTTLGSTFSVGIPHELFRVPGGIESFDVDPLGERFLIVTPSAALPDNPITVVLNWWTELDRK